MCVVGQEWLEVIEAQRMSWYVAFRNFLEEVMLIQYQEKRVLCMALHYPTKELNPGGPKASRSLAFQKTFDDCDEHFVELANIIEWQQNLQRPKNAIDAKNHYINLLYHINQIV